MYAIWKQFAEPVAGEEILSKSDIAARTRFNEALDTYNDARVAVAVTLSFQSKLAARDPRFRQMSLSDFAAEVARTERLPDRYSDYRSWCEAAGKLASKFQVPTDQKILFKWSKQKLLSAREIIARQEFDLLGTASGVFQELKNTKSE